MKVMVKQLDVPKCDLKRNKEVLKELKWSQYWTTFVDTKTMARACHQDELDKDL
jgi:hypothetical protein